MAGKLQEKSPKNCNPSDVATPLAPEVAFEESRCVARGAHAAQALALRERLRCACGLRGYGEL